MCVFCLYFRKNNILNNTMKTLITNINLVNENIIRKASVLINNDIIETIFYDNTTKLSDCTIIDGENNYLLPGIIDDQVHFRDPGLTHKGDIYTESKAAIAGGVTSFMDMPNVNPQTTTQELLAEKFKIGAEKSLANFSFYFGATNNNLAEVLKTDPKTVCGIKIFMGSSTGNMLVDNEQVLSEIFAKSELLIATHCEDENTIQRNTAIYKEKHGENMPIKYHAEIRSDEACYLSSAFAVKLAKKYNTRLHVLHLSSAKEMELFDNTIEAKDKKITAEVCVHHLWFNSEAYQTKGTLVKWNPAIKFKADQQELLKALLDNKIDVIATDHAPHTIDEKMQTYFKAPSGGPMVQHSLVTMLEMYKQNKISLTQIVDKMCHKPAEIFNIEKRGYIREGYKADLTLIDLNTNWTVEKSNILYKCGWSPLEGTCFSSKVVKTFVNGNLVFDNGKFNELYRGERLIFSR